MGLFHRVRFAPLIALGLFAVACNDTKLRESPPPGPMSGGDASTPALGATTPAPPFLALAAGGDATCGVVREGDLYCWGRNDLGQLGDGTQENRYLPVPVGKGQKWMAVAPGGSHTCALAEKGATYCWGSGVYGEIGNDTLGQSLTPIHVTTVPPFTSIASGENHSCGLTAAGALWCWGDNRHGELARGDTLAAHHPVAVTPGIAFRSMSLAGHATCAVTTDARLFCWGLDNGGALGYLATTLCEEGGAATSLCSLSLRRTAGDSLVRHAALGYEHGCALTPGGTARCWGSNGSGELGTGSRDSAGPSSIAGELHFSTIAAGAAFSCGLAKEGDLYCWGTNDEGQTGTGTGADSPLATIVQSPSRFIAVSAGRQHACAVTTEHVGFCWGDDSFGQVGGVAKRRSFMPDQVMFPAAASAP